MEVKLISCHILPHHFSKRHTLKDKKENGINQALGQVLRGKKKSNLIWIFSIKMVSQAQNMNVKRIWNHMGSSTYRKIIDWCHIKGRGIKGSERKQVAWGKIWDASVLWGLLKTSGTGKGDWTLGIYFITTKMVRPHWNTRAFPGLKGVGRREDPLTDKIQRYSLGSEEWSSGFRGSCSL